MLNLLWAYLLVLIILLGANISLFLSKKDSNIKNTVLISLIGFLTLFFILNFSFIAKDVLNVLNEYMYILFFIISILLFLLAYYSFKNNDLNLKPKNKLYSFVLLVLLLISAFLISSQFETNSIFNTLLFSILFFIVLLVVMQISKLLFYAKRSFHVIRTEFMILEAIFIFLCALTYSSAKIINVEIFSSFLILTPTYLLIYILIVIIAIILIGIYLNDRKMKKDF